MPYKSKYDDIKFKVIEINSTNKNEYEEMLLIEKRQILRSSPDDINISTDGVYTALTQLELANRLRSNEHLYIVFVYDDIQILPNDTKKFINFFSGDKYIDNLMYVTILTNDNSDIGVILGISKTIYYEYRCSIMCNNKPKYPSYSNLALELWKYCASSPKLNYLMSKPNEVMTYILLKNIDEEYIWSILNNRSEDDDYTSDNRTFEQEYKDIIKGVPNSDMFIPKRLLYKLKSCNTFQNYSNKCLNNEEYAKLIDYANIRNKYYRILEKQNLPYILIKIFDYKNAALLSKNIEYDKYSHICKSSDLFIGGNVYLLYISTNFVNSK